MKKILLASAGVMVMSAGMAYAACIPTPSCSSLGYESSSSCEGGIKCPFGNAWNCTLADKITEITTEITEIKKVIEEGGDTSNCVIGSVFYSDWTCSSNKLISGKTPIGVVVYTDGKGHGQVMSLDSIGEYQWATVFVNLSSLSNWANASSASSDLQSCANTIIISVAGNKTEYPAAWATKEYSTKGTSAGDWCLPAAGIMTSIYNNMTKINAGLILAGGMDLTTSSYIWTSSEFASNWAYYSSFRNQYGLPDDINAAYDNKNISREVRPVLEF